MNKNYNYTRAKLYLPEYGRHIQEMVESLLSIPDRNERTRQARAVVAVMGNINPVLRDAAEFKRKLWDHLFIMSDFELDVDSPYPLPSRIDLMVKPNPIPYPQSHIRFKPYGKNVERFLKHMEEEKDERVVKSTIGSLARYMRTKSYEYNQEHPNNEAIIRDIHRMSDGVLKIDEEEIGAMRTDYRVPQQSSQGKKRQQKGPKSKGQKPRRNTINRDTVR